MKRLTATPSVTACIVVFVMLSHTGCGTDSGRQAQKTPAVSTSQINDRGLPTAESSVAECCKPASEVTFPSAFAPADTQKMPIPDVTVLDQDGKEIHFQRDLVKGKVVVINFVFTSCKAACPLLGASFAKLQETLGDRLGAEVSLISVSVDPVVDRPERLKEWAGRFGARPGWTFVTCTEGHKADLDRLLKALQVFSPEKTNHSQSVLVIDGDSLEGRVSRTLAAPEELEKMVSDALRARSGRSYFTDAPLIDQDGRHYRFYSDLVQGKVVVINPFFTTCKGSCPVMSGSLAKLQARLGDRLGKEVVLLSLTVDPATDTLDELAKYAKRCGAGPGWHFLTGKEEDLFGVERKLGQFAKNRDDHTSIIIVGNESTGLWMKHLDPSDADGLYSKVEEALSHVRKSKVDPR